MTVQWPCAILLFHVMHELFKKGQKSQQEFKAWITGEWHWGVLDHPVWERSTVLKAGPTDISPQQGFTVRQLLDHASNGMATDHNTVEEKSIHSNHSRSRHSPKGAGTHTSIQSHEQHVFNNGKDGHNLYKYSNCVASVCNKAPHPERECSDWSL